jgi:DNA invertase Pin-like site-specific DNA recombinase
MLLTLNAENPSRALAYVRVSSQRQVDEGVSIEAQIKRIKEYARYKGLTLEDKDILIEKGVSGGIPIWERPVGRNLKMRLETGEYPHLLTMKLDRMFRLVPDALLTVDELANAGISCTSSTSMEKPSIRVLHSGGSSSSSWQGLLRWREDSFQREHRSG